MLRVLASDGHESTRLVPDILGGTVIDPQVALDHLIAAEGEEVSVRREGMLVVATTCSLSCYALGASDGHWDALVQTSDGWYRSSSQIPEAVPELAVTNQLLRLHDRALGVLLAEQAG